MLRFKIFENGVPAKSADLEGAHLLGSERVPLRAELTFAAGELRCAPRARGAAALSIMWPVPGLGRMMMETPRLLERTEPYNLHVELARGQLMRISHKREDWGLYDYPEDGGIYGQIDAARDLLVAAMTAENDKIAAARADDALAAGVKAGEALSSLHAEIFLSKRRQSGEQPCETPLGCRLEPAKCFGESTEGETDPETRIERIGDSFDFVSVPMSWRRTEPRDGQHVVEPVASWIRAIRERKMMVWGRSLLSFDAGDWPTWLKASAKNYDPLRDRVAKQLKHLLKHFAGQVHAWEIVSGIHASNPLKLSFEQIVDLTRTCAILAKQHAPKTSAIIGITLPWGEYYAKDPQTIPPLVYADMTIQSGIPFDGLGIEIRFGDGPSGQYMRDLMQISSLLDRFGNLGKPLHITAAGVPSEAPSTRFGAWRGPWSEDIQATWLREFSRMALSKPFVETVTWQCMADGAEHPGAGLLRNDLSAKPALRELDSVRLSLFGPRAAASVAK